MENNTEATEFLTKNFTDNADLEIFSFLLFLPIYLFTLTGNLGLIALVIRDSHLHKPMYYSLSVLSSVDSCYFSVIMPQMVADFMLEKKVISVIGCAVQMFLAVTFGTSGCFLLAAMSYDHYAAIHNPLLYVAIISPRIYVPLIFASYAGKILHAVIHIVASLQLYFCGSNEASNIFCEIPPFLAISCSEKHINQLLLFYCTMFIEILTILIVLMSYGFILLAILRTYSAEGKRTLFYTYGPHLTTVSIFHGTALFMYVRPSSRYAMEHDMVVSIIYSIVNPMLNPLIYSLRNKDVKEPIKQVFCQRLICR
ncbi:olfactory receptor 5T7-like [Meriones unguiculatus]|uniref:olfactory receptor 5T7-like n=1 Tax=Meriones unguiculatus TaxID=10047 RepID=UPI000B4E8D27|nr:olfactory receptor 5T7-like [Meriones unguiculatus]